MDVVDNFKHQELRDYYQKWYNPQNQCVIVVGDIDINSIEFKIEQLFGSICSKESAGEVVKEEVVDHHGIIFSFDHDKELQENSVFLIFKHQAYTPEQRKFVSYWRNLNITNAALSMMNIRLDDEVLKTDCSFISASVDDDDYFLSSTKGAFQISCEPKDSMQAKALTDILIECRRASEYGFTEEEYQRYKMERISQLDNFLMSADKRESSSLASEYYNNYLYGTDISSANDYVAIMKHIVSSTTLGEVNRRMKELLPETNDNMVIGCWSIEKDSAYYPSEKEDLDAGDDAYTDTENETESEAARLLLMLPEEQREAVYLCYYEGYTVREAAAIMEVKETKVRSALTAAKRMLRRKRDE